MKSDIVDETRSRSVIGAFLDSYYKLGYGFLESVYSAALVRELEKRGHAVEREVRVDIIYDGEPLTWFRCDLVVDRRIVLEVKTGPALPPFAKRQLTNYLRSTCLELGYVLHYGPKPQFHRIISTNR